MNRVTLKLELDLDFVLIAVTSSLKDYRLCHQINKCLNIDFSRMDELLLPSGDGKANQEFNRYGYFPDDSETEFYLISNKGSEGFLIPEMNKVDYFVMIKNFIDDEDLNHWLSSIKKIQEVLAAVELDPKKLKSKENLLF